MFAEFAKFTNGKLHTCDISEDNIASAKKFTREFIDYIQFYTMDSLIFLNEFREKLIYCI